jgi:hypothetical protein
MAGSSLASRKDYKGKSKKVKGKSKRRARFEVQRSMLKKKALERFLSHRAMLP